MTTVYRLVREVNGEETNSVVLTKHDLGLVMGGIYYAKEKDYHQPRVKSYGEVYKKIKAVVEGVKKPCFG